MDAFELNKIVGATLAAILFVVALNKIGDMVLSPNVPDTLAYKIVVGEAPDEAKVDTNGEQPQEQQKEDATPTLATLLAGADIARGAKVARKCAACHSLKKGGPNKVGPGLWGVVGRDKAAHAGFKYSAALKNKGGEWTFEELDAFLTKPKDFVPGTKMSFAGIKDPKDRAALLLFLRSLSEAPVALPGQ